MKVGFLAPTRGDNENVTDEAGALDNEICRLLVERFDHAFELAKIKKRLGECIRDKQREHEVLEGYRQSNVGS